MKCSNSKSDFDVDQHKILLPHVICVEGNIGSGKSTLLKNLKKDGFHVIPEPVTEIWGQYLPRLYEDPEKWGFGFQMEVIDWFRQLQATHLNKEINNSVINRQMKASQMFDKENKENNENNNENLNDNEFKQSSPDDTSDSSNQSESSDSSQNNLDNETGIIFRFPTKIQKKSINDENMNPNILKNKLPKQKTVNPNAKSDFIIVERSALSAFRIFALNLLESNCMSKWEYSLLKRFYSLVMWQPKYILYLRCDPNISISRIHKRNRNGENKVNPELIKNLHNRHEKLFVEKYGKNSNTFKINEFNIKPSKSIYNLYNTDDYNIKQNPSIVYVNATNDPNDVLNEAIRKISNLPIPEPLLCNLCNDCGTPRVRPRISRINYNKNIITPNKHNCENNDNRIPLNIISTNQ